MAQRGHVSEGSQGPMKGLPPIPLFDRRVVRNILDMKRDAMFSYSLREMVLPPIQSARPWRARDERLMERAGGGARSARALPWFETEKDSYQHHAEYLKRLSKLREELIHQEQSNLANALDRLRMRSYGREFVYSKPQKEKKLPARHSAQADSSNNHQRRTLLTTFEKFQRMRPKKEAPPIMPLEGKSLIESSVTERSDRSDRTERRGNHTDRASDRSVDESVRLNLQRLASNPIPSIPRKRGSNHRDIVLESSSYRRHQTNESNNSSAPDERIAHMQKQKQKLMKLRHEHREAEKLKLSPQTFRIETLNDEDRMNLDRLKDYYCIYYIPAPATSPVEDLDLNLQLPVIHSSHSCKHSNKDSDGGSSNGGGKSYRGYKVAADVPVPASVCNCTCRMFVSGNKVETPFANIDYSLGPINRLQVANEPEDKPGQLKNGFISSRPSTQSTDQTDKNEDKNKSNSNSDKVRIRVDMPPIVFNSHASPEPLVSENTSGSGSGLVKAFKQKELRQKELSNLFEDVKELNKRTDTLAESVD